MLEADEVIRILNLQPHPREDGYFVETYRSDENHSFESSSRYAGKRCYSTAIYFLLKQGGFSEIHRLQSDEIFHFYSGAPAELLLLPLNGKEQVVQIGNRLDRGEVPQVVVPRGCWQGMQSMGEFTLLGTTVAPGFEYSDYESGDREHLIRQFPRYANLIRVLTRKA